MHSQLTLDYACAISQVTVAYLIDFFYTTLCMREHNEDETVKLQDDSSSALNSEITVPDQESKESLTKESTPTACCNCPPHRGFSIIEAH
jgi:hypothetical protein